MTFHIAAPAAVSLVLLFSLLAGSAAAAPTAAQTRLYLRYDDGASTTCGGRYLSTTDGQDGAGEDCQSQTAITTFAGQTSAQEWVADARAALPITVDASRHLTGELTVETMTSGAFDAPANWAELDVVVTLNNTALPKATLSSGGVYQEGKKKFTFSVDVPDSLDKVAVTAARIDVTWKRVVHAPSVYHASISQDDPASFFTIPSYVSEG